ncbi:MAG: DUF87 domain-containing protein, partial [Methanotrichaceae archaeon]
LLLYHPAEAAADVGQQFSILEMPDRNEGLIIQVISNDSLEYAGLKEEMIQRILERQITPGEPRLNLEQGMDEIKSLKMATSKIRKRISNGQWLNWDGWIPTRNVEISTIDEEDLLANIIPDAICPIRSFTRFNNLQITFDGQRLDKVNVIAGVKGSGKSHLAKHVVIALSEAQVPCIIFDINGEYTVLPDAQILRWGENYLPNLAIIGYEMILEIIRAMYPLPETSDAVLDGTLPVAFRKRREKCERDGVDFTIDIPYLMTYTWPGNDYVRNAINDRLRFIDNLNLFLITTVDERNTEVNEEIIVDLMGAYDQACEGMPIVFDISNKSPKLQKALVKAMNNTIENICKIETVGAGRYPFVFYEEAHFYISDDAILNIITRGRHLGLGSFFVTNTPQNLPDTVFRQLDNLFLLGLTHRDDIRSVSKNSFTDEDTIQSFATRMPEKHALITGKVTDRYSLVVEVDPLPEDMPATGRTKSTWDRFLHAE